MNEHSKIAITGATGMVGVALASELTAQGHTVVPLKRGDRQPDGSDVYWDPQGQGVCDPSRLAGVQTVVHLAGENIAAGRWTAAQKKRIYDSRVIATRHLVESLAKCDQPPDTFVCASAIGIYGDRGDEALTEASEPGTGFLAEVCRDWEAAAAEAEAAGMRVVQVRIGVVLSRKGGALTKMLTPFKLCVGGNIGDGKQFMSWISLPDVVAVLRTAIDDESMRGPVNAVSPNAMTNADFTKVLGKVLGRPTILPLPAFMAKLMLGEMADELLLSSAHVIPGVLAETGFTFQHADLEACLRHALA